MVYFLIKNYQKNGHDEKRLGTTALKCNQIILNKIITIKDFSSVFCGRYKWKEHLLLPHVAYSTSR